MMFSDSSTIIFVCNSLTDTTKIDQLIKERVGEDYGVIAKFSYDEYNKWLTDPMKDFSSYFADIHNAFFDVNNQDDIEFLRIEYIKNGDLSGCKWLKGRNEFSERLIAASVIDDIYDPVLEYKEIGKIYDEVKDKTDKPDWWVNPIKYSDNTYPIHKLDGKMIVIISTKISEEDFEFLENNINAEKIIY